MCKLIRLTRGPCAAHSANFRSETVESERCHKQEQSIGKKETKLQRRQGGEEPSQPKRINIAEEPRDEGDAAVKT